MLRLAQRRHDEAILGLAAASSRAPLDPQPVSDLAAAYLARSSAKRRAFDVILALDAADRALTLEPRLVEARYHRALALTRLGLRHQALAAWLSLPDDGEQPWSSATRAHVPELGAATANETWQAERPLLEAAALRRDSAAVVAVTRRFPHLVRLHAEEHLLPDWGRAQLAADAATAAARLTVAREVGAALAEVTGDSMIADTAAGLGDAREGIVDALAAGLADFGRGVELFNRSKMEEARAALVNAGQRLRAGGSLFAGWADFYSAVCDHYKNPRRAHRAFSSLRAETDVRRYPVLAGRATWLLGTIANNRGKPEEALRSYGEALALIDSSAGPQLSSFVHLLLGETYSALGEVERSWEERLVAFDGIGRTGEPRRVHAALNEAAIVLLNAGYAWPALELSAELRRNATAWGKPSALAEAAIVRGWALDLLGHREQALAEFRAAAQHAAGLEPAVRDRVGGALALAQARAVTAVDARRAIDVLTEALAADHRNGYSFQLTHLLTARARAHRALGEDAEAESDLHQAIEHHEDVRRNVREEPLRASAFERAQEAFDEMIGLQIDRHHDAETAFAYAERARSRLLLDLVADRTGSGATTPAGRRPTLGAAEVERQLPDGLDMVEYAVLPDRLVAWILRRGSLELVSIDVGEADLGARVETLRNALQRRAAPTEIRAASAHLHATLIAPLAGKLRPAVPLVVVPDRFLAQVPFAALVDSRSGRYLIEDRPVSVAPSATLLAEVLARGPPRRQEVRSVLAIGDPAFDRQRHPRLQRLPAADTEAAEVAALYPDSQLLRSDQATRRALLDNVGAHQVLHFAGHALLHPSPHLSRLLLAVETGGGSGSIQADEIARLRLEDSELVVLSACRTVGSGNQRESVTGLAAAFLAAGAPAVVASLWDVEDRPARELMGRLHRALRQGEAPAGALRSSQLALLTGRDASLRSPASWAGFEVLGGIVAAESH